ncbi:nucleotidyltransferase domain-containing protein [soil metagenome]
MEGKAATDVIKSTILSMIPGAKILLFGSRARGDFNKDSDYDLLVITPDNLPAREKSSWMSRLNYALVKALKVPVDVLVNSEEEVSQKSKLPGHIIRWAMKEGVEL